MIQPQMIRRYDRYLKTLKLRWELSVRLTQTEDFYNPNVVKVVRDQHGFALYFLEPRSHGRDIGAVDWKPFALPAVWRHVGLYVYRRALLLDYRAGLEPP